MKRIYVEINHKEHGEYITDHAEPFNSYSEAIDFLQSKWDVELFTADEEALAKQAEDDALDDVYKGSELKADSIVKMEQ